MIKEYTAMNLEEFLKIVSELSQPKYVSDGKLWQTRQLWYRGERKSNWNLLPALYRSFNNAPNSELILQEEYLYQHFKAKSKHLITDPPSSQIGWEEIMQHYETGTRFLDWTESAIVGLSFAVEVFLNPKDNEAMSAKREKANPCVWVLDPVGLNNEVYSFFSNINKSMEFLDAAVRALFPVYTTWDVIKHFEVKIIRRLCADKKGYFSSGEHDLPQISGIVSLTEIVSKYRQHNDNDLLRMMYTGELNPFFYLLMRFYGDGLSVQMNKDTILPPLATVQPYHNERIRAQRGVFTVFPHYDLSPGASSSVCDLRAMNNQERITKHIYKIHLPDAHYIARELLLLGGRRFHLYPEFPNLSKDLGAKGYFV